MRTFGSRYGKPTPKAGQHPLISDLDEESGRPIGTERGKAQPCPLLGRDKLDIGAPKPSLELAPVPFKRFRSGCRCARKRRQTGKLK